MTPDLEYTTDGVFTRFMPCTKAGEAAWLEMSTETDGSGTILTMHLPDVLRQLRAAGYSVRKARVTLSPDVDELLAELTGAHVVDVTHVPHDVDDTNQISAELSAQ